MQFTLIFLRAVVSLWHLTPKTIDKIIYGRVAEKEKEKDKEKGEDKENE